MGFVSSGQDHHESNRAAAQAGLVRAFQLKISGSSTLNGEQLLDLDVSRRERKKRLLKFQSPQLFKLTNIVFNSFP
jgi:hypothetical protein